MGENAAVAAARLELEEAEGAVQNILEQVKELESKQPSQSVSIHLYVLETRGIPSPFQAEVAIKHGSMHGDGAPILARGTFSSAGPVDPIELPGEMNSMALSIVVRGAATPPAEAAPEQASHDNGDDVGATAAAVVSDIVTGALSRVERNMVEVAVNFEIVAEEIVRFGTEQGEWAHSVAGDEQGLRLKIAVIREDSGPAIDSQLAEEIHAEFEAASTRTYAAKRALADLLEDQGQEERENQVTTKVNGSRRGSSGGPAVRPGFLHREKKKVGRIEKSWNTVSTKCMTAGKAVWRYKNHIIFASAVSFMALKGDIFIV